MKILPYIVFCFLILSGVCTSMNSYHNTENRIAQDVNQALKQALSKMPGDMVTTDTIQCYRKYHYSRTEGYCRYCYTNSAQGRTP